MAKDEHYTAIIEILHIQEAESLGSRSNVRAERRKREVSRIVIRADSINSLITKATAHLNLVED